MFLSLSKVFCSVLEPQQEIYTGKWSYKADNPRKNKEHRNIIFICINELLL